MKLKQYPDWHKLRVFRTQGLRLSTRLDERTLDLICDKLWLGIRSIMIIKETR